MQIVSVVVRGYLVVPYIRSRCPRNVAMKRVDNRVTFKDFMCSFSKICIGTSKVAKMDVSFSGVRVGVGDGLGLLLAVLVGATDPDKPPGERELSDSLL